MGCRLLVEIQESLEDVLPIPGMIPL